MSAWQHLDASKLAKLVKVEVKLRLLVKSTKILRAAAVEDIII